LGQLGSSKAIAPLIALFEELAEEDGALNELPMVMGMMND